MTAVETEVQDRRARAYGEHRDYVLRVLRRRCGWLDETDRESMFHDAFLVLLHKEDRGVLDVSGMAPHQVRAYLTQAALNKALDEGKRVGRQRSVPLTDDDIYPDERSAAAEKLVDGDAERARVHEIVGELPARQQTIVRLRFFFERTPVEIQELLGISERAYRRDLERAMHTVAAGFELLRSGEFCDSRRSLILAFVAGIAGPHRAEDARRHIATCRGCAAWAAELRTAGAKVAAVAPPVLMGGSGRLGGMGDRVLSLVESIKHQAANLAVRTDAALPTQFAGARPGAAVAAITGCLAVGGGATYCAVEGLPLRPAPAHHQIENEARKQARKAPRPRVTNQLLTPPAVAASSAARPSAGVTARTPAAGASTKRAARRRAARKRAARLRAEVGTVTRAQRRNAELTFEGGGTAASPGTSAAQATIAAAPSAGTGGSRQPTSGSSSDSGPPASGSWSSEFAP